jgi:hypothetical protein
VRSALPVALPTGSSNPLALPQGRAATLPPLPPGWAMGGPDVRARLCAPYSGVRGSSQPRLPLTPSTHNPRRSMARTGTLTRAGARSGSRQSRLQRII